jgi:DNA-binding transcriptional MocR family regulator
MMENRQYRYEQVIQKIEETIQILQLKPGDKIPSVRKISSTLNVSTTTVFQAYSIMEDRGLITSRPRSGFIISGKRSGASSSAKDIIPLAEFVNIYAMERIMMENTRKYGVINFSILAPVNELLPIAKINKAMQASVKEVAIDNYQYPFLEGHPRLLSQVALHSFEWNKRILPKDILITNGCMEAISLCLDTVTRRGDIVAVESPSYHAVLQCLESRGLKALSIGVDPVTGLNIDELEGALMHNKVAACIFMPACHNPTGASMPEENKIRLVKLLGERNIPLIEDDALGELYFGSTRPLPAKAYDTYDNVLYCSSFSKTLPPGFRIGWVAAGKYQPEVEMHKFSNNISTNSLLQDAIGRYLEGGTYNSHLKKLRAAIKVQYGKYIEAILRYFPDVIKLSTPSGGFSFWIEFPEKLDITEMQKVALMKGISFCPGHIFSPSERFKNYIRINCCPLFNAKTESSLTILGDLAKSMLYDLEYQDK